MPAFIADLLSEISLTGRYDSFAGVETKSKTKSKTNVENKRREETGFS
jgi:hypothetical protein